jgi:hypothetical protein
MTAILVFFIITKVTRTSKVFNYTAFQYTKIDVASVSAKFNFAHLLLVIVDNRMYNQRCGDMHY